MFRFFVTALVAICFVSCGFHAQLVSNHNLSQTQVLLQNGDFRVVGKAMGEASATYILGIGGLSQKAVYNNAIADMFNNANLSGSQTIVHINVHQHIGGVPPFYVKARYLASGTIIEFIKPNMVADTTKAKAEIKDSVKTVAEIDTSSTATYKVGDIYSNGKIKGIVVSISANGKHGKIISLKQSNSTTIWATRYNYIGAINKSEGKENCKLFDDIQDYPIMNRCVAEGVDWYLPSIEEMECIYKNIDTINKILLENGNVTIEPFELYWTSSEKDRYQAVAIQSTYHSFVDKQTPLRVIPMSAF